MHLTKNMSAANTDMSCSRPSSCQVAERLRRRQ